MAAKTGGYRGVVKRGQEFEFRTPDMAAPAVGMCVAWGYDEYSGSQTYTFRLADGRKIVARKRDVIRKVERPHEVGR